MLMIILPMVGLVIDVGIMYAIRARLTSACDAAARAAARSLAVGVTLADQEAAARARAQAFFNANFRPAPLKAAAPPLRLPSTSPSCRRARSP
jgi:Flp pilus assembly protein TadG